MAARFRRGGRLLAYGEGARRSDVSHVVVEFVHPVIVGKRALPAVALDTPRALDVLGRPEDIVLLMSSGTPTTSEAELLRDATARGMLALALTGVATRPDAEFHFPVAADDPLVVQEAHEVLYHVLWELVHVFVEHREAE
jgi:D-sedoheptulose 7-phosphate isomerase